MYTLVSTICKWYVTSTAKKSFLVVFLFVSSLLKQTKGSETTMTEAAKQAKREYQRLWHKQHPEKNKEYLKRYWERKAEKKQMGGEVN